jgi:RNA polymerase sigma-70 factor, ECF subfamily
MMETFHKTRGSGTRVAGEQPGQRFREVVLPHLDDALSLARWLTGSFTDAEDVVQDACVRALSALETQAVANSRAWLLAIVRNTTFTWLGKNRPKALVVTDDDRVFEEGRSRMIEEPEPTPEAALIAKADAALLHGAIAALPTAFRETLVLREITGLSYREIAEVTNSPIGTVMSRLARARDLLLQRIGDAHTLKGRPA